ncbi:hypothetical protein Tco_1514106 [Tanacetum coccineum]
MMMMIITIFMNTHNNNIYEPDVIDVIGWGSLLATSFVHKNMDLAKVAAERLLLIDRDDDDVHECMRHNDDDVHDESSTSKRISSSGGATEVAGNW